VNGPCPVAADDEVMLDWQNTHATTSLHNEEPVPNKLDHREIPTHPEVHVQPSGLANIMG
jgi:hypothetical protein